MKKELITRILKNLIKLIKELVLPPKGGKERKEITIAMAYSKEQYSSTTILAESWECPPFH